ncbi:MAG: hypothetical protein HYZ53_15470 [Planctomycetes bacterium]|nr:hypothetical protein [Planctomycetota bacterium]
MSTPRRYLKGLPGCLWLVASLFATGWGTIDWLAWAAVADVRAEAAAARPRAERALAAADARIAEAMRSPEAGAPPRLPAKYGNALRARLDSQHASLAAADQDWAAAETALLDRSDRRRAEALFRRCAEIWDLQVAGAVVGIEQELEDLLHAAAAARETLDRFEPEAALSLRHVEELEAREVPGLRTKYALPEADCRFRFPEAHALLADARRQREDALRLLEPPAETEASPDPPAALAVANQARALLQAARSAADKRIEGARLCNERYDILRARIAEVPAKRAAGEAAVHALGAEFLPRYQEGLLERIAGTPAFLAEVEKRFVAEIERYKAQDFGGALAFLDEALALLSRADDDLSAAPLLLTRLRNCRAGFPSLLERARTAVAQSQAYVRAHAGDVGGGVADGARFLPAALERGGRQEWLEAYAEAERALRQANDGLASATRLVAAAERARELARRAERERLERAERAERDRARERARRDADSRKSSFSSRSSNSSRSSSGGTRSRGSWGSSGHGSGW